jgi:hypothetical protein
MAKGESPSGYAIFCDDVRHEVDGKITLVGTYFNDMVFSGVHQGFMPYLNLLVGYQFGLNNPPQRVTTRVIFCGHNGEDILMIEDSVDLPSTLPPMPDALRPDWTPALDLRRYLRITPAIFPGPGWLRVRGICDEEEMRLGSLKITINPPEATSETSAEDRRP